MKLSAATSTMDLSHRRVSKGGLVEIGVYRVLFGFRIRAGFTGSYGCEVDWCCGDDWSHVEMLYSICLGILEEREENLWCFDGVPGSSAVKPFFNDRVFVETVVALCPNAKPVRLIREESGK